MTRARTIQTWDVFDRIQADDMKQAATIMAAFVYQTAMRDEKTATQTDGGKITTAARKIWCVSISTRTAFPV
jgi:hypothetical protein